jgi:hypothetical protein
LLSPEVGKLILRSQRRWMIGAQDPLAIAQQLSKQLDCLRYLTVLAQTHGEVASRDEGIPVIGTQNPLPAAELQQALGFRSVPVVHDTWFYLPI